MKPTRLKSLSDEALTLVAERFKVLSEPTRLRILAQLQEGERSVGELVGETGAGQANVSKHLGLLHRHGILGRRKEGLNVYYWITDATTFELCSLVCHGLEAEVETRRRALPGRG